MEWKEDTKRKLVHAIKKLYIQKRVVHKRGSRNQLIESVTYLPTLVFNTDNDDVVAALRGKFTVRHFRTGKRDGVIWGRRVKRTLEVLFDYLSPSQKELATIVLAFPSGRGKRDIKEKLFKQFYDKLEEIRRLQRLSEGDPALKSVWVCDSPTPQETEGGSSTTRLVVNEQYVFDVLEGLIFSDAHVSAPPGSHLVLGTTNRLYVEQVYRVLHPMVHCKIYRFRDKSIKKKWKWVLNATSVKIFRELRTRWYDELGKKRLPEDFKWTPIKLNVAYCGDGSLSGGTPMLCLHSFTDKEVKRIVDGLEALGIFGTLYEVRPHQYILRVFQDCAGTFFSYIGATPVLPCYNYKWSFKEPSTRALKVELFTEQDLRGLAGCIQSLNLQRRSNNSFEIKLVFKKTELTQELLKDFCRQGQVLLYGTHAQRLLSRLLPYVTDSEERDRYAKVIKFPLRRRFSEEKEQEFVNI